MTDRYASFANSGPGRAILQRLGLPTPPRLRRFRPEDPLLPGPVLLAGEGRLGPAIRAALEGCEIVEKADTQLGAIIFDATAITDSSHLRTLYDTFHPYARSLLPSGRVVVLGTPPEACGRPGQASPAFPAKPGRPSGSPLSTGPFPGGPLGLTSGGPLSGSPLSGSGGPLSGGLASGSPLPGVPLPGGLFSGGPLSTDVREAVAQRALEGFVRSVGKEFGRGSTAQLVYVAPGAEDAVESTLKFLLSGRSAYVSGQVVRIGPARMPVPVTPPLDAKVALVTGAARGIGAAIAEVLARDGAHVVCLDVPASGEALSVVADSIGGTAFQLDLTAADAPDRLAEFVDTTHGGVDIVVHNAGITRDKTIGRMTLQAWDAVIEVNLTSQERVTAVLLARDLIPAGGRIVCVSSVSGIAGNRGQTNYAASKAGVIGLVQALAPVLREREITVNAVAPGFIETAMTAAMPAMIRQAGRRLNSLGQGGLPVDVAETIAWLAAPDSAGVTGNVVRVCGQSLMGA